MKTFEDLRGRTLTWTRTGFWARKYELRAEDGEIFGTMSPMRGRRSRVAVRILNLNVTFERARRGAKRQRKHHYVVITSVGLESEIGSHAYQAEKGILTLADGQTFTWKNKIHLLKKTEWVWMTPDGAEIVSFKAAGRWGNNGQISIDPAVEAKRGLPLLVALGWYLILLYQDEMIMVFMAG